MALVLPAEAFRLIKGEPQEIQRTAADARAATFLADSGEFRDLLNRTRCWRGPVMIEHNAPDPVP
jgi:hypothetical protein